MGQTLGDSPSRAERRRRLVPRLLGAVSGVLAAGVALGVAELTGALLGRTSSPLVAVGGAFVDRTPRWLKEWAIRQFGESDKTVLLGGILLTVAVLAAVVGAAAVRRRVVGVLGVSLLGVVAAAAAVTRPSAAPVDAVPSLVGALLGLLALIGLLSVVGDGTEAQAARTGTGDLPSRLRRTALMRDRKAGLGRRAFLASSLATGAVAVAAGAGGRELLQRRLDVSAERSALRLPPPADPAPPLPAGARLDVDGISPLFTRPRDFYRVDTALVVPRVSPEDWSLRVHGLVDRELRLSFDELLARPLVERDITMTCVSNEVGGHLVGTSRWLGARLADVLDEAGVRPDADQLLSTSVDGMTIGTPTAAVLDGRDALLAVAMDGEPLLPEHGFPVRMVVPGLYGYVSATKWVVDLELTTFAAATPYWVDRGWEPQAPVRTASRIDTPRPFAELARGTVAVAGVAWAQQRGISRVEVRVDGGPWQQARLSAPVGVDVWRQWVWRWDAAEPGNHTIEVRATDGSGTTQPERRRPIFPDGSTGWHSVVVRVA